MTVEVVGGILVDDGTWDFPVTVRILDSAACTTVTCDLTHDRVADVIVRAFRALGVVDLRGYAHWVLYCGEQYPQTADTWLVDVTGDGWVVNEEGMLASMNVTLKQQSEAANG